MAHPIDRRRDYRSQSAMEYLMTYGWAILIIAVVLSVLFQLGVFSSGNFQPHAQAGACQVSRTAAGVSLEGQCNGLLPQFVASDTGSGYITTSLSSIPTTAVTLTAWVKTSSQDVGVVYIGNSLDTYGLLIYTGGEIYYDSQSGHDCSWSSLSADDNSWHFVALVIQSTEVTPYMDERTASPCGMAIQLQSDNVLIGARIAPNYYFNGNIANVQIYNTTLSPAEINALYLEGIGGAPIRPQNIVGWWPLNGNANDYSGNGNNGQITSGGVDYISSWESGYTAP